MFDADARARTFPSRERGGVDARVAGDVRGGEGKKGHDGREGRKRGRLWKKEEK